MRTISFEYMSNLFFTSKGAEEIRALGRKSAMATSTDEENGTYRALVLVVNLNY